VKFKSYIFFFLENERRFAIRRSSNILMCNIVEVLFIKVFFIIKYFAITLPFNYLPGVTHQKECMFKICKWIFSITLAFIVL